MTDYDVVFTFADASDPAGRRYHGWCVVAYDEAEAIVRARFRAAKQGWFAFQLVRVTPRSDLYYAVSSRLVNAPARRQTRVVSVPRPRVPRVQPAIGAAALVGYGVDRWSSSTVRNPHWWDAVHPHEWALIPTSAYMTWRDL